MEGKILAFILVCNLCMHFCEGDTATPYTIAENRTAQFPCNVEVMNSTIWLFTSKNKVSGPESLSQGSLVYERFQDKYKIEKSSYNSTSHVLNLIFNATEDDEGVYHCQEEGTNKAQFDLVVEIPPVLQLKRDNTVISTDIDVVSNKEVTIECVAEGGKPPVTLSWKVNGQNRTGPFIDDSPPSTERRVTSVIHYLPTVEDNTLSCVTSGQQVIPGQEVLVTVNVQYLPNCVMGITNTTNAFVITCSCKANPEVKRFEIYVNGSLFSQEMQATLPSEKSATVFCNATNDVGSFATQPESLKPFHEEVPLQLSGSALVIGLCVAGATLVLLISIAVFAVCMYCKKKKVAEETEGTIDMTKTTFVMANKPVPDYDSNQDDNTPLKDTDKEENPDTEDGSKKPDEQKDGDGPVSPSQEEEPSQEEKTLIDNADKGTEETTEETPNKKEQSEKPLEQNDGEVSISTPHKEVLNQEEENLI